MKARSAGTPTNFYLYSEAFHVFVGVPVLPEAKDALGRARAAIQAALAR